MLVCQQRDPYVSITLNTAFSMHAEGLAARREEHKDTSVFCDRVRHYCAQGGNADACCALHI